MKQRQMARRVASQPRGPTRWANAFIVALAAAVVIGLIYFSGVLGGGGAPTPTRPPSTAVAGLPTDKLSRPPEARPTPSGGPATPNPGATATLSPTASPTEPVPPTRAPTPTAGLPGRAPSSPAEFDMEGQVIDIAFPLRQDTRYRYRNNYLDFRDGSPDSYNHARITKEGATHRLHDGIDIYARVGEPLVAPFTGTVVNPAQLWQPWEPDRYGRTILIVSAEPETDGYMAMLVHCDRVWVQAGQQVTRGQVVGTLGKSGNAELQSVQSHLHFELRAPFLLDWTSRGELNPVDAFNPYPSLEAADPKRS